MKVNRSLFKAFLMSILVLLFINVTSFAAAPQSAPKYIFMFIGDGMGIAERQIAELQLNSDAYQPPMDQKNKLIMNSLKYAGITKTYDSTSVVPDSASTATSLVSGYKTLSGVIGMKEDKKTVTPFLTEALKKKGYAIGIISSVKIVHATPAAYYSHIDNRNKYDDIAIQLINSNFDLFVGGGGDKHFNPEKRKDKKDMYQEAETKGFYVARTSEEFMNAKPGKRLLANLPGDINDEAIPYAIDRHDGDLSLSDIVRKSISVLAPNKKGFFMMVEGGKIDWACHANDTGAAIGDTLDFDKAVAAAVEFKKKNPNTLIIVTGDHETGGLGLSTGTEYRVNPELFLDQKISFEIADQKIDQILKNESDPEAKIFEAAEEFGLTNLTPNEEEIIRKAITDQKAGLGKFQLEKLYGGYKPVSNTFIKLLNLRANLNWTSYAHTGVPVLTTAEGAGAEKFAGYYDNTDICKILNNIAHAGLKW